jgi:type II secretory pathway pseudopilin PulG
VAGMARPELAVAPMTHSYLCKPFFLKPTGPNRAEEGFTLVEILVALFVMLVGISSAFALFAAATALHKRATDQTSAAVIAESVFSQIQSELTAGVELSDIRKADLMPKEYESYKYDLELVPVDVYENEIYVKLTVTWRKRGTGRKQEFSTILIRHIPFRERDYSRGGR